MVEGADAGCNAKPRPDPAPWANAGVPVAAVVLLMELVPAAGAGEFAALVGRGFGSNGGLSIMLPAVGATWFTNWGVIACRF